MTEEKAPEYVELTELQKLLLRKGELTWTLEKAQAELQYVQQQLAQLENKLK